MLKAAKGRLQKLDAEHPHTLELWHNLIAIYESWNKPDEAANWRAKLPHSSDDKKQD